MGEDRVDGASLSPCTTWNTPTAGRPRNNSASRSGTGRSRSDGLRMKALPYIGDQHVVALNGVMPATTPRGWRIEYTLHLAWRPRCIRPSSDAGIPVANSITSMPR